MKIRSTAVARGGSRLGPKRQAPAVRDDNSGYRLIDLFSGAGGLTLGFTRAFRNPFVPVWANDFDRWSVETYNSNLGPHCVLGDIVELLRDPQTTIPPADIVIGGPPCQGFSLLNKKRSNDARKQLWRPFLDVVERCGASVFVMENVPQLLSSSEFDEIRRQAESLGFLIASATLLAADYGVPQIRKRAFVVGSRLTDPALHFPPAPTHQSPARPQLSLVHGPLLTWKTVRDAIGDLPAPKGTDIRNVPSPEDLHFGRSPRPESMARYRAIPKEGMNRFDLQRLAPELTPACWVRKKTGGTDLFGRLWWDRPAFTIRTEFFKPEKGRFLHPKAHRPITHREAARFQTFPDSFRFRGTKIEIAKQIGNAVPPLLAARVAHSVVAMMRSIEKTDGRQDYARRA